MQLYNRPKNHRGKCAGGDKAQEAVNKNSDSGIRRGTLQIHKKNKQKDEDICNSAEKNTPSRKEISKKTIEKDPTLTTKENEINRSQFSNRKQIKRKNITSPLKESTKKNKQKIETVITSKPQQNKPATSKSPDSVPPTLPTTN